METFSVGYSFVFPRSVFFWHCIYFILFHFIFFSVTAAMKKKMNEFDVDSNVQIVVPRNMDLEKKLLDMAMMSRRRNRLSLPNRHIPFGIRGARRIHTRRATTVMFVGITANPDKLGNHVAQAPTPIPSPPSPPPAPV